MVPSLSTLCSSQEREIRSNKCQQVQSRVFTLTHSHKNIMFRWGMLKKNVLFKMSLTTMRGKKFAAWGYTDSLMWWHSCSQRPASFPGCHTWLVSMSLCSFFCKDLEYIFILMGSQVKHIWQSHSAEKWVRSQAKGQWLPFASAALKIGFKQGCTEYKILSWLRSWHF